MKKWIALLLAAILFAVLLIKYFAFDKKQTGMSFIDLYGLRISGANLLRSILLAVCVFLFIAVLLNGFYELFASARMRAGSSTRSRPPRSLTASRFCKKARRSPSGPSVCCI